MQITQLPSSLAVDNTLANAIISFTISMNHSNSSAGLSSVSHSTSSLLGILVLKPNFHIPQAHCLRWVHLRYASELFHHIIDSLIYVVRDFLDAFGEDFSSFLHSFNESSMGSRNESNTPSRVAFVNKLLKFLYHNYKIVLLDIYVYHRFAVVAKSVELRL